MVDDGWTDTLETLEGDDRKRTPSAPGVSGPEDLDQEGWEDELENSPRSSTAGMPPGGDATENFGFDQGYQEIAKGLDFLEAQDEQKILGSMLQAGYLEDDRLEDFAGVTDADLNENAVAAIAERPDGRYNLFVDEEDFYRIHDEMGVEEAASVMRHELNHYRDLEDDLLPELRTDGDLSIMLSYFAGNNLQGSESSMEGATQFITEMENKEQTSELHAYPAEVRAFQEHLKEYGPTVASEIKEQVEEEYSFLFDYDSEREVYDVEVSDGRYVEKGEVEGEGYVVDLDLPEIGELSDRQEFQEDPEGLTRKPMNEREFYGDKSSPYETEQDDESYSLRQVDDRDVTETVIGGGPLETAAMPDEMYDEVSEGPRV